VKQQPEEHPRRRTGGGGVIHNLLTPSPPCGRLQLAKPKCEVKEWTPLLEY
jgi:hypothetical protein